MAKRKKSKGFAVEKKSKSNNKYVTIFEQVTNKTGGEKKSFSWYKQTVKNIATTYEREGNKLLKDEKLDSFDNVQDKNILRKSVKEGHLYFFEYQAISRWIKYYDRFPLVYVIKDEGPYFYGANLHYVPPKSRLKIIKNLEMGMINVPKNIIHKYISEHVTGLYLDLASEEWETSILLPVEDFVAGKSSNNITYDRELVWNDIIKNSPGKLKAKRIIKGYGSQEDKEMVV